MFLRKKLFFLLMNLVHFLPLCEVGAITPTDQIGLSQAQSETRNIPSTPIKVRCEAIDLDSKKYIHFHIQNVSSRVVKVNQSNDLPYTILNDGRLVILHGEHVSPESRTGPNPPLSHRPKSQHLTLNPEESFQYLLEIDPLRLRSEHHEPVPIQLDKLPRRVFGDDEPEIYLFGDFPTICLANWIEVEPEYFDPYSYKIASSNTFPINLGYEFLEFSNSGMVSANDRLNHDGVTSPSQEPLQVKCDVEAGQLRVEIENVSNRALHILGSQRPHPFLHSGNVILLYGVHPYPDPSVANSPTLSFVSTQAIQPGETIERRFNLNYLYPSDAYGSYRDPGRSVYHYTKYRTKNG